MEFSFGLIGFLIAFPLIVAAALLFVRQEGPRRVIVCVSGVVIALASVVLVMGAVRVALFSLTATLLCILLRSVTYC